MGQLPHGSGLYNYMLILGVSGFNRTLDSLVNDSPCVPG